MSYKRDRKDLFKGQEEKQPDVLLSGSQGKRQLSTLWGTGEPRLHLDLVNQVTGAGDRDKWLDLGH